MPQRLACDRFVSPATAQIISALNHPMRREILRALRERESASAVQVSRSLEADLSEVAYHFKVLAKLKTVKLVGRRRVRGANESFYRSNLNNQTEWVDVVLETSLSQDRKRA